MNTQVNTNKELSLPHIRLQFVNHKKDPVQNPNKISDMTKLNRIKKNLDINFGSSPEYVSREYVSHEFVTPKNITPTNINYGDKLPITPSKPMQTSSFVGQNSTRLEGIKRVLFFDYQTNNLVTPNKQRSTNPFELTIPLTPKKTKQINSYEELFLESFGSDSDDEYIFENLNTSRRLIFAN